MVETKLLHGRYRIEETLASGGMGKVFCATDERLGRTVAVKMLRDDLAEDERFVERFRREARAAASLSHPNVAGVYDYGEDAGKHFIVMEYVDGRDLARVLREEGPLDPDRATRIAAQTAVALAHSHSAGLVHRDVKPANIIILDGDRVKVTDFGIARASGDSTLTATGSVLGSAHYISPEQAEGNPAGPHSDIYGLGIVLYEMLTGALPFTGDTPLAVAMRHVNDTVPPPSRLNPDVPPELDEVVARATRKNPADRFPDGAAMAAALNEASGGTEPLRGAAVGATAVLPTAATTRQEQSVWPIPGERWDPRRIGRAVMIGLAVLLVLAIGLLIWRLTAGATDDEPRRRAGGQPAPVETSPAPTETMPSLVDLHKDVAKQELEDLGLGLKIKEEPTETEESPPDTVIGTTPGAGANLEPGQEVTLHVAKEPKGDEGDEGEEHGKGKGHDKKEDKDD